MNPLETQVGGDHYRSMKIQPAEFIHANGIPFLEGCAIKYVCRHRAKGKSDDIRKAIHFLELLLRLEYKADRETTPISEAHAYYGNQTEPATKGTQEKLEHLKPQVVHVHPTPHYYWRCRVCGGFNPVTLNKCDTVGCSGGMPK